MRPLPWSTNQLKKLGYCIRDGVPVPTTLPDYDSVMVFYNDLAAEAQAKIAALDWTPLLDERVPEVTSRPKTIDTLRQKLQRDRSTPLPNVQDIAGVRFEAEMTLEEQDAVVTAIAGLFNHNVDDCKRDMRAKHHSGYRAVHLWLRLEGRVEVQIRTHLQGQWANTYETVADVLGRGIRYGERPEKEEDRILVEELQGLSSELIATLEDVRNSARAVRREIEERAGSSDVDPGVENNLKVLSELESRVGEMEQSVQRRLARTKDAFDTIRTTRKV